MINFKTKEDFEKFIIMNIPIAVQSTRPAKTKLVNPFTSQNARNTTIEALVDAFDKKQI